VVVVAVGVVEEDQQVQEGVLLLQEVEQLILAEELVALIAQGQAVVVGLF
jgi:hypothetical protein